MRRAFVLGAVVFATGCGASRDPLYYAMGAVPGAPLSSTATIELRRPELAGYLDRSDIVGGVVDRRLRLRSGDAWGEPLDDMIDRVLAEDLRQRLGATVLRESESIGSRPDTVVAVDVGRFEQDGDGRVVLEAHVVVSPGPGKRPLARQVSLNARPKGGDTPAMVDAMSELLGRLADAIARAIVQGGEGATAAE
jgi:hypothetical protein